MKKILFLAVVITFCMIPCTAQQIKKPEKKIIKKETKPIVEKVEIDASFPGGTGAFTKFLAMNVDANVPSNNKAKEGSYTVIITFAVDKEGKCSDFVPKTTFGYGMEEEVIRVLKLSPKWTPASQNGRFVKAYRIQSITFAVLKE